MKDVDIKKYTSKDIKYIRTCFNSLLRKHQRSYKKRLKVKAKLTGRMVEIMKATNEIKEVSKTTLERKWWLSRKKLKGYEKRIQTRSEIKELKMILKTMKKAAMKVFLV